MGNLSLLQGNFPTQGWNPGFPTQVCIVGRFFTTWVTGKPKDTRVGILSLLQSIFSTQESCLQVGFLPTELSSQFNSPSMRKRSGLWREYSPPLSLPEHLIWCSGNWLNKIAYYSSLKHSVLSLFKNFTAHLLLPLLLKTRKNKTLSYFDYVVLKYGADLMKWPEEISSHFLLTDL